MHTPSLSNVTATAAIYTLSLHDALPIWPSGGRPHVRADLRSRIDVVTERDQNLDGPGHAVRNSRHLQRRRSEEHTSELQSLRHLVCRLLLEKKTGHRIPEHRGGQNRLTE